MNRAIACAVHGLGVISFVYPFFIPAAQGAEQSAHASDAPVLFSVLAVLLIGLAVAELRDGAMDPRRVAMLGVLCGVNAVLRLPGALGGASLMFVLPILCGYVFGARFGFLLGSMSFAASAVITGGIGPWLPFQMWALGWVGAGAGLIGRVTGRSNGRVVVLVLCAYGWATGYGFGALINLWFWPFQAGPSDIAWSPGLGAGETLGRYWSFYALTSLAWDSARSVANVVLIAVLGRPLLRLLMRYRSRTDIVWEARHPGALGVDASSAPAPAGR